MRLTFAGKVITGCVFTAWLAAPASADWWGQAAAQVRGDKPKKNPFVIDVHDVKREGSQAGKVAGAVASGFGRAIASGGGNSGSGQGMGGQRPGNGVGGAERGPKDGGSGSGSGSGKWLRKSDETKRR